MLPNCHSTKFHFIKKRNNLSLRILDQQEEFLANRLDFDINNFNTLEDVSKICHFKDSIVMSQI